MTNSLLCNCSQRVRIVFLGLLLTSFAMAQPSISGVQNNYSYLLPAQPNYGIAPGSIFIVKGTNLANTTTGLQNVPLQYSLDGVSAAITVNGTTKQMIMYYVTPGQIGGILPSATPVGDGTISVTNNNQTSAPFPIKVVASAFGLLTLDGSGSGLAAVFDPAYHFLGDSNPTQIGEGIVLWGSGLGAAPGDETVQQTPTDLQGSLNISVNIGGKPAQIAYAGRSIYPGLDQINVTVGAGTPLGCTVSLVVTINGVASNYATIPVAAPNATTCAAPAAGSGITQQEINSWIGSGQFREGGVSLTRETSYVVTQTQGQTQRQTMRSDQLSATFNKIAGPDLAKNFNNTYFSPVIGDCTVISSFPTPNLTYSSLDAGPSIDVSGPAGIRSAPKSLDSVNDIVYSANVGDGTPGNYIDPGQYTATGSGGVDVGAFSQSWTVAPELVWTNHQDAEEIDRSQDFTVTWTGGNPDGGIAFMQGSSFVTDQTTTPPTQTSVTFECWANISDGQFTIPAAVLSQLPASQVTQIGTISIQQRGTLDLSTTGKGARISPTPDGLDYATVGDQVGTGVSTLWK